MEIPLLKIPEAGIEIYSDCIVTEGEIFAQLKTS